MTGSHLTMLVHQLSEAVRAHDPLGQELAELLLREELVRRFQVPIGEVASGSLALGLPPDIVLATICDALKDTATWFEERAGIDDRPAP